MCCYSSRLGVKELRKLMKDNGGKMTFWKVVKYHSAYSGSPIGYEIRSIRKIHYLWNEGIHSAPDALYRKNADDYPEVEIEEGFHVYLDKNRAMKISKKEVNCILLEVTCNVKDLIGAEEYDSDSLYHYTAVFSKVEVTKDQWKRLKRRVRDAKRKYR